MKLAIFGDVHLYSLALKPWDLLSKRALGQANLWLNRRTHFDPDLLEGLVGRIEAVEPDLLLGAGDLTTTALSSEFAMARARLGPLFERFPSLIIPGNHDRYTFRAARHHRFEQWFEPWCPSGYPYHFDAGGLHVVALDATRPNRLFDRGEIGDRQMRVLAGLLRHIPAGEGVMVLCHYTLGPPPGGGDESTLHRLIDEAQLLDTLKLADRPAVYVHGHVHRPWLFRPEAAPNVLSLNAGSPTHVSSGAPRGQGFWELDWPTGSATPARLTRHVPEGEDRWRVRKVDPPAAPHIEAEVD